MEKKQSLTKYSLLEQESTDWFKQLLGCSDNKQYVKLLLEHPLVKGVNDYLKENPSAELD